jgi:dethiobiotin synthetase
MRGLFITGTDTNCGKTTATLALIHLLKTRGKIVGMKPIACGCELVNRACRNDDALRIQAIGSVLMPYELINPYAFSPPIAPHLAAIEEARPINVKEIANCFHQLAEHADLVIVEGIGGWLVPLGQNFYVADLPTALNIPVLLVIGMRLGCLNHALLTVKDMLNRGIKLSGWIANLLDPTMLRQSELLIALNELIPAPCLGYIPYVTNVFDVMNTTSALNQSAIFNLFSNEHIN